MKEKNDLNTYNPVGVKTSIKRRKDVLHIRRKVVEY